VQDLDLATSEILRVLRPGGLLLASAPFAYSEHGSPFDFRRFSYFGLKEIFKNDYEILECRREGGVGSTVGTLMLNWIDDILDASRTTRIIKAAILPVWLVFCFVVNLIAIMLDGVDSTEHFYGNVLIYARKKGNPKA
jgi:SAM-dependent methyltransferase